MDQRDSFEFTQQHTVHQTLQNLTQFSTNKFQVQKRCLATHNQYNMTLLGSCFQGLYLPGDRSVWKKLYLTPCVRPEAKDQGNSFFPTWTKVGLVNYIYFWMLVCFFPLQLMVLIVVYIVKSWTDYKHIISQSDSRLQPNIILQKQIKTTW